MLFKPSAESLQTRNVFCHVMECTLVCSAISDVRYSQLLLLFDGAHDYSCFGI